MKPLDFLTCLALALTAASCARPQQATVGSYLYEITCEAIANKYDTRTERRVEHYDLAARSGTPPLIPVVVGPIEVCLVNSVSFDATTSTFYAVVPAQGKETLGPIGYTVATFAVPAMSIVGRSDAGAFEHPPRLEPRPGSTPQVITSSGWLPPSEPLATYGPEHRDKPNLVLARSGHRTLVDVATPPGVPELFGVADESTKTFVVLQDPGTSEDYVHFAPGGSHVLVEDTLVNGGQRVKTGAIRLYDSTTGRVVKTLSDERVRSFYFRAASPDGKVLYELDDAYWFLDFDVKFGAEQVEAITTQDYPLPMTFFSSK